MASKLSRPDFDQGNINAKIKIKTFYDKNLLYSEEKSGIFRKKLFLKVKKKPAKIAGFKKSYGVTK
ncbi:hypothetical protein H3V17_06770 [Bartonella sp. M0283]|uniref:hypothetical protein n=1 Tax=Bartonella sp. M0283 TaxID=2751016 RepID=UPI0018DDCCEB|nr:hypothetical protein [Bartonella sp. M0283]MBI0163346.1 hypothetical protein [Bartonella sp. M0283]